MANPFRRATQQMSSPRPRPRGARQAFNASVFNRLTSDWVMASSRSANGELRYELRTMRNRARELVRNSPFGVRYHQLIAENVVGPTGFQLCAKNLKKDSDELYESANTAIEDAWRDWCRPETSDVQRKLSFTENLALSVSGWGTDGEMLIRMLRGPRFGPYEFAIQVLDVDYLCDTLQPGADGDAERDRARHRARRIWGPSRLLALDASPVRHAGALHGTDRGRSNSCAGLGHHPRVHSPARGPVARDPARAAIGTRSRCSTATSRRSSSPRASRRRPWARSRICRTVTAHRPNPNAAHRRRQSSRRGTASQARRTRYPAEVEPGALLDLRGKGKLALWDPQHPTSAFPDFTRMMSHFAAMGSGSRTGR
jgi:hypothetical protein